LVLPVRKVQLVPPVLLDLLVRKVLPDLKVKQEQLVQ
jgi:hypothetical protein